MAGNSKLLVEHKLALCYKLESQPENKKEEKKTNEQLKLEKSEEQEIKTLKEIENIQHAQANRRKEISRVLISQEALQSNDFVHYVLVRKRYSRSRLSRRSFS